MGSFWGGSIFGSLRGSGLYQQHMRYSEEILGCKTKKMLAELIMVLTMNSAVITARTTPNRNSSNSLMTVLTVTTIVILM